MTETCSILVIEDSEDDRALYRRALKECETVKYDVAEAEDGDEGLRRCGEMAPDCVLLDYSLPGRNGVEVLKRLRVKHPHLPVVMFTGQGNETVAVAAMQAGAQDYVVKSTITPDGVRRAISFAIAQCAMERRIHEQRLSLEIFTRALAHDLREPVRTIKSFMSVLSDRELLSPDGRRYFGYVHDAADRMGSLIEAVYYYTRLDASSEQPAKEACDLDKVFQDTLLDLGELIREREAVVTSANLPQVQGVTQQLRQVLQNLISNAIRHCDADPAVHVDAVEEPNAWLIRVTDNGDGVAEAQRDKIFEPFTRFAHRKAPGLGMGLAICKRIVEAHGGQIRCEAGETGGARFVFALPKAHGATVTAPAKTATADAGRSQLAKVLVVDDNEAAIELTRIVLVEGAKLRCVLVGANGAREGLSLMRKAAEQNEGIDLVLLDINMPEMDGFEFLQKVREDQALSEVPVVMCTTSSYDKDMERAKTLGAAGYITKPAELGKLRALLNNMPTMKLSERADGKILLRVA